MSKKTKWTRNQIILLMGLIITFIGLLINSYFLLKTSNQQIIIKQDVNEIKSDVGDFKNLTVENFIIKSNGSTQKTWCNGTACITSYNSRIFDITYNS